MCLELHQGAGGAPGLFTTEACAASRRVYTQGPELHLDLVGQQEPMLLLDVSTRTLQGRELHLHVFRQLIACAAAGLIYTSEACIYFCYVLHLDMSTHWGLSCIMMCLELHHRARGAPGLFTSEACGASRLVYTQGPELHLDVSYPEVLVRTYC
jgi:hypothetical protein